MGPADTVNTLSVETPDGYRDFHLVHGDLSAQKADLLVFFANAGTERPVGRVLDFYRMWRAGQLNGHPQ
jgi:hypothetical protein